MKLWTPEEPLIKGRSMVGYSRRSMLGFIGLGVAAMAFPKPAVPRGYTTLSDLFDQMANAAGMTWGIDPASDPDLAVLQFHSTSPFQVGQEVEICVTGIPTGRYRITDANLVSGVNEITAQLTLRDAIRHRG